MRGKFNVHKLGRHNLILLGIPWLKAMNPIIDWAEETLTLPWTEKSDWFEEDVDIERKKNRLPALFPKKGKRKWKNLKLPQETSGMSKQKTNESVDSASVQPQNDSEHAIKSSLTPEKVPTSTKPFRATIEEIVDDEAPSLLPIPDDDDETFDEKHDVWINQLNEHFAPAVSSIAEYALLDEEFLVEYSADSDELRVIENVSMDTPLTRDRTSFSEQKTTVTPLPRPTESPKTSNLPSPLMQSKRRSRLKNSSQNIFTTSPTYLLKTDLTNSPLNGLA
jgi:hypothetical protein